MSRSSELAAAKRICRSFDAPLGVVEALAEHEDADFRAVAEAHLARRAAEEQRLIAMSAYERWLQERGTTLICGIDEAGRGPLAGPVVAAAVILPPDCRIWQLDDSKKLSEKVRLQLEEQIKQKAIAWAVAGVNHAKIDEINILQAALLAMRRAVNKLTVQPQHLLIDALEIPHIGIPQTGLVHGDAVSVSIAAASILAKNHRDRIMQKFDAMYPAYGYAGHKGYPTAKHRQAVRECGPSPIQRLSFTGKEQ